MCMFYTPVDTAEQFLQAALPIHTPIRSVPVALHTHDPLVLSVFVILTNLMAVQGVHILVFISISLTTNEGGHFSYVCRPFGCVIWKCLLKS